MSLTDDRTKVAQGLLTAVRRIGAQATEIQLGRWKRLARRAFFASRVAQRRLGSPVIRATLGTRRIDSTLSLTPIRSRDPQKLLQRTAREAMRYRQSQISPSARLPKIISAGPSGIQKNAGRKNKIFVKLPNAMEDEIISPLHRQNSHRCADS